jgi:hypothetical protein
MDSKNLKYKCFFGLLLFYPALLFSQSEYKGKYIFEGIDGGAEFEYRIEDNNPILEGDFKFRSKIIDSLDKRKLFKLNVIGSYKENKKHDNWEYITEDHLLVLNDVIDFEPDYTLQSTKLEVNGFYKEGLPHGEWILKENIFSGINLRVNARSYDLRFSEGAIIGNFLFEKYKGKEVLKVEGKTLENGVMDGNWEFIYLENDQIIKETRRYEKGFLIGLNKINEGTNETIQEVIYYNTINKLNALEEGEEVQFRISDNYFGLIYNDGFQDLSTEFAGQSSGNELLEEFLIKTLSYDSIFVGEREILVKYPINTRRFRYELSEEDLQNLEDLEKEFRKFQNDVNSLADRNALAINKSRTDSLAFAYEFFQYTSKQVEEFSQVIDIFSSDDIFYIDQSNFSKDGFSFLKKVDFIEYQYQEENRSFEIAYESLEDDDKKLTELFRMYIAEKQEIVDQVSDYVLNQLKIIRQSEELADLEENILEKRESIDELIDALEIDDLPTQSLFNSVKQNIYVSEYNALNEEYSEIENAEERFEKGQEIILLLETMEFLVENIPELANKWTDVVDLYTESTLDPFTFNTSFKVLRKRRLVEAGSIVYNSYLNNIRDESSYRTIKDYFLDIEKLIFRMEELREANTNRLEKRLGSETDVSQIIKILGL